MKHITDWFNNLRSLPRLVFSLLISLTFFAGFRLYGIEVLTAIMLAWDTFCLLMVLMSWVTFGTLSQQELVEKAQAEDESRYAGFVLITSTVCVSLVGILLLLRNTDVLLTNQHIHRSVSLAGVGLSWILLHTIFTLRYAHLYYANQQSGNSLAAGGLDFPDEDSPDYLDFAYFSFVLGMTFQVSDVSISSRSIRRVVLLHSLISFAFNTVIVALTISILSGIGK